MAQEPQTQAQPPAPAVAPPSPPATPGAPATATATFPGGEVVLQPTPTSAREVAGLHERRDILRDQLQRAVNRREELVSEMNETGNPEARAGLQQRLNLLDERILQLERDQANTEQLLSNASPEVLALAADRALQNRGGGGNDEEMAMLFFFALGLGIVLTMIIGRWRRRRARKRAGVTGTPLPDDPRLERLSQAVDAIAEEVERIGEGQRFVTQLLAQRKESPGLAAATERREPN